MQSLRAAAATVISALIARDLRLDEFYWAPISTIVIILSPNDPLSLAWQRFVGTALGAVVGGIVATLFHFHWAVYGAGIFICGILSAILRLGSAYRFAAIALSIVLLIAHQSPPWIIAATRFIEVSLGIAVALVMMRVWPVRQSPAG